MFTLQRSSPKQIIFAPLDSPLAQQRLPKNLSVDSLVVLADDKVFIRSTAALKILSMLHGRWGVFGNLLTWIPSVISDSVYRIVAISRYKIFGKYDQCPLPPEHVRSRIISTEEEYSKLNEN